MFEVTFDTVLLVVLILTFFSHDPAKLINWVVEFTSLVSSFNREILSYQADSVEFALYLINTGDIVIDLWVKSPNWLSKGETLVHVLHELLLSLHRNHAWKQEIKLKAQFCFFLFN